jgi:hypothetical protein
MDRGGGGPTAKNLVLLATKMIQLQFTAIKDELSPISFACT